MVAVCGSNVEVTGASQTIKDINHAVYIPRSCYQSPETFMLFSKASGAPFLSSPIVDNDEKGIWGTG